MVSTVHTKMVSTVHTKMVSTVQIWPRWYLQFRSDQDGIYSLDLTKRVSTVHTKMVSTVQIWPRWYLQFRSDQDGIYSSYQDGIYSSYQNGIYSSDLTKMVSTVQIWPRWYLQFRSDQEGIYAPSKALVHLTPCFYDTVQHSSLTIRVGVLSWTYWSEGGNRSWENRSAFSGAWDTTCGHKAKDVTLSIAWMIKTRKEEILDDLFWKDERGLSSVRHTLVPFRMLLWENARETWWDAYGSSWVRR